MADQEQNTAPSFSLQRTYVKDASLEMPNAPQIFLKQDAPTVEVAVNVGGQRLADNIFESTVTATITTRVDNQVLYLAEMQQAGIYEAHNIPADQIDPLLGIVCPTMLYPYLRANIADLITRSSMPPLHLAEVNFQALYEQRVQELAQQQTQQQTQQQNNPQTSQLNGQQNGQAGGEQMVQIQQGAAANDASGLPLPPDATRQ